MFFNRFYRAAGYVKLCLVALLCWCTAAHAQDSLAPAQFELKPGRCVALHEGQSCYAKLQFRWSLAQPSAVCIKQVDGDNSSNNDRPLRCWPVAAQGSWEFEFESERSRDFILVERDSARILGRATFTVAWVYDAKSRRQSHWRVF